MTIDYSIARAKARKIMRFGFGKSISQMMAISAIAQRIGEDEMTQIVAISYYLSKDNPNDFYNAVNKEFTKMGVYRNKRKKELPSSFFEYENIKASYRVRQLYNLYRVIGFELFYRHVPHNNTAKGTLRRWCHKAFANRKNVKRGSLKTKRRVENILNNGGFIRFSETSSSVYIKSNEGEIRISDHETTSIFLNQNIILQK
ncbi:MAG: hypothetical protein AB8B69_16955 [Chitinophagales bacterium]